MTEAEIMKGLECCKAYNYDACSECHFNRNADCAFSVATNCLDLINRKNAKIEKLTINMNAFGLGMKREKERADIARAEAIKEVLKKAKRKAFNLDLHRCMCVYVEDLDQIAKEMGVE